MILGYIITGIAFIIAGLCCATVFVKEDNTNDDTSNNLE